MKKLLVLTACIFAMATGQAQFTVEGSNQYGRLKDITYDLTTPNKLYALANFGNHILVSLNNGASWNILYTFPDVNAEITNFRILNNSTVAFIVNRTVDLSASGVYVFNIQNLSFIRHYEIPNPEDNPTILNFDFSDPSGEHVILHSYFSEGDLDQVPRTKIFSSANYGADWNLIYTSQGFDDVHINNLVFEPGNPEKIFLARDFGPEQIDGGLLISTDSGTTWEEKLPGILLGPIAFNPLDSNDILMGTDISGLMHPENIYRSLDGGETWSIIPNDWHTIDGFNNIYKIAFDPSNPDNIIVLEEDVVGVSSDNGATWTNTVYLNSDANGYYSGLNVSYNPFVAGSLAITTDYYPQISTDYGITLSQLYVPYYLTVSIAAAKNEQNDYIYYGAQGGVVKKNIATNTFTAADTENAFSYNPNRNYLFTEPSIPSRVYRFVAREDFSTDLYLSDDYGATYIALPPIMATDAQAVCSDPQNSNIFYMSFRTGDSSVLVKYDLTNPQNITATNIETPGEWIDGLSNGVVTGIQVSETDSNVLYLTQRDKFYISTNQGVSWQARINGLNIAELLIIRDMVTNPFNADEFMIGTNTGIYKTLDAGLHWEHVYSGGIITQLQYSDLNSNVIVASNNRESILVYSLDGGENWVTLSPEDTGYVRFYDVECIFKDDTFTAYFATRDLGVVSLKLEDLPLGTDQPEMVQKGIKIYPNPSSDIVNVVLSADVSFKKAVLYSMTGQKVMESESTTVNIKGLSNGLYILNVEAADGSTYTQKLIKD